MGAYRPPPDEYVRPTNRVFLKPDTYIDNHFVRGTSYHQEGLRQCRDGMSLEIELVPEPGNPEDHWAVALHVDRKRIGYISAQDSGLWQDVVSVYNRRGMAVYAEGIVRSYDDGLIGVTAYLPGFSEAEKRMAELGLFDECDRLIASLAPDARQRILNNGRYGLDESDVLLLQSKQHLAPSLNWRRGTGSHSDDRYPNALYRRLITVDRIERERVAVEREEARRAARLERQRAQTEKVEAKANERKAFDQEILSLSAAGKTKSYIRSHLACSDFRINRVLTESGIARSADQNQDSKHERLTRGRRALQMQRDGITRKEIAAELGCSLETVKAILKDAKFYEDPESDPDRLQLVLQSKAPFLSGIGYQAAAMALGVSEAKLKEARRDLSILTEMH